MVILYCSTSWENDGASSCPWFPPHRLT